MTALSPLQLNNLVFSDVKISAQTLTEAELQGSLETVVQYRTQVDPNNKRIWQVAVRVHLRNPAEGKTPYTGTVECVGMFTVAPEWPEEKVEQLVAVNGTAVLYSSIREMVCGITARGPWGMIMLPTQSFISSYEESKKAKAPTGAAAS